MFSDDFEVIAYKVLSYLYACLKQNRKVDIAAIRSLAGCNEHYLSVVIRDLQSNWLVSGFVFDGLSGIVIESPDLAAINEPVITMDGAVYVKENGRMEKAKGFLGRAFDVALRAVIESATPRI